MTPEEPLRTVSERAGFVRTVSKGMSHKTSEDVDDGFGNFLASCREYIFSRTHPDSDAKLSIYKYTEIGLVLDDKDVCHHNVHGIERSLNTWRQDPKLVWSYPEAQIAAWMSYDTENQSIFLKNACKNLGERTVPR